MKSEAMTRGSGAFAFTDDGHEDTNELFGLRVKLVCRAGAERSGFGQELQPICRLVQFLQSAFHLADELRVRTRTTGLAVMRTHRRGAAEHLAGHDLPLWTRRNLDECRHRRQAEALGPRAQVFR